ncbi:MAG: class I SAM-dependent methyltransferase [Verrucomicrobiae bacterium]|nr:class I SAM-dependent methyltransferase [Verrucomicrobiae bacterium]
MNQLAPDIQRHLTGLAKFPQARMPGPEVYEAEYDHWPWGKVLEEAVDWVEQHAPKSAFVVDYMCGTGFLLNQIVKRRRDIVAVGCDIYPPYVRYAEHKYAGVKFVENDALVYQPDCSPDLIICTAGIHHLERQDQARFIEKVSRELVQGGLLLVGEELISPFMCEEDRKRAVLEMFGALMAYIDKTAPPDDVVQAVADVMVNDWCERGEYKTSKAGFETLLAPHFDVLSARQIWPEQRMAFGDWLFVCSKRFSGEPCSDSRTTRL